ncbi:hypothetical protein HK097_009899 [Rhizophlyctis rosea]|uniref:Uncharacterized protein n=1 Tax=Rhizophlyctis rosea TaxID=64517 RepID=A0AAD5X039_9FUNG|nr:hypothetical protein HK097_009899 [Rhizophlyctis rosea]
MAPVDLELASDEVKQQVAERMTAVINRRYGGKAKASLVKLKEFGQTKFIK